MIIHPVREYMPIYLAAIGPKNLELAGEKCDGWLAIFFDPEFAPEQIASVHAGMEQGRASRCAVRHRADRAGRDRRRREGVR